VFIIFIFIHLFIYPTLGELRSWQRERTIGHPYMYVSIYIYVYIYICLYIDRYRYRYRYIHRYRYV